MTTTTVAKKNTQKLQRAIVDGLEDVKAQDIAVYDTEHLSPLFERVIIASGTSNRQTKALAASVRDAVREAGFPKPRVEGEGNGEWIIVDCAQVVVHIMQPNFRQYYHLEELWGEKPVRLKLGAAKPVTLAKASAPAEKPKVASPSLKRSNAAKKGVAEAFPSKAQVKKNEAAAAKKVAAKKVAAKTPAVKQVPAKQAPAKKVAAKAASAVVKTVVVKAPAKRASVAAKAAAPAKKVAAKKAAAQGPAAKKTPSRKA